VVRRGTVGKTIFTYVYIEKIFSRTSKTITIKLGINHPWVQGILNCSNKGPGPLQGEIITTKGPRVT
jgi:hypothetical protein